MKRRDLIKGAVVVPATVAVAGISQQAAKAQSSAPSSTAVDPSGSASGVQELPEFANHVIHSDMDGVGPDGVGPDGVPTGQSATYL